MTQSFAPGARVSVRIGRPGKRWLTHVSSGPHTAALNHWTFSSIEGSGSPTCQTTCVCPLDRTIIAWLCAAYKQLDERARASSIRIAFILFPSQQLGASGAVSSIERGPDCVATIACAGGRINRSTDDCAVRQARESAQDGEAACRRK